MFKYRELCILMKEIDRPAEVNHSIMNSFFEKVLEVQS